MKNFKNKIRFVWLYQLWVRILRLVTEKGEIIEQPMDIFTSMLHQLKFKL